MSAALKMKPRRILNGEPLEEVNKFKGAGSMFIANKQGKSFPWCGMPLHTKGVAYQTVVCL